MKNLALFSILIFSLIFLTFSCKKLEDPYKIDDYGHDYFPLLIGKYIEYEVDSMVYSLLTDSLILETKSYVREEIVDTLSDNLGNTLYRTERFEKQNLTDDWEIKKVFTQSIIDNQAFRTEDNLKIMPLVFPILENKSWDGNIFVDEFQAISVNGEVLNMFKEWSSHRMRATEEPDMIGDFSFENTLTVSASNSNSNNVEERLWIEKYAKGVGLFYRELWILDSQCENCCGGDFLTCESTPWEEKAEKGFILKQMIIDHN